MSHTLVVRLDSMGDVLVCGPAIRAVAAGSSRTTVLAGPAGAEAALLLPGVDDIVVWDCPWISAPPPPVERAAMDGLVDRLAAERAVSTYTSWSAHELASMVELGRLDYVLTGACGDSGAPTGALVWETISLDPVFCLVAEAHPAAREKEVELADLAREQWAVTPGEGCFADCFAMACARAGFTPGTIYETDVPTCTHLAQVGRAVALCQATHQPAQGLAMVPLAGAPLRWRQLLGRHPTAPEAAWVVAQAKETHRDAVRRSPVYHDWLVRNPGYGTAP